MFGHYILDDCDEDYVRLSNIFSLFPICDVLKTTPASLSNLINLFCITKNSRAFAF